MWGDRQTDERTDRQKETFWPVSTPAELGPEGTASLVEHPRLDEIKPAIALAEGMEKTPTEGQSSMDGTPKSLDMKYGSTDVRMKYGKLDVRMADEVTRSMKYDKTVTPSVSVKNETTSMIDNVCDVNN